RREGARRGGGAARLAAGAARPAAGERASLARLEHADPLSGSGHRPAAASAEGACAAGEPADLSADPCADDSAQRAAGGGTDEATRDRPCELGEARVASLLLELLLVPLVLAEHEVRRL